MKCRMLEAHVAQLQRVMSMTSMENSALKDELVRVKKSKDGVKSGVAEPAVLESSKSFHFWFLVHASVGRNWNEPFTSTSGCSVVMQSDVFLFYMIFFS